MRCLRLLLIAMVALMCLPAAAAFVPPPLHGHVVDDAGVLSAVEIEELDAALESTRAEGGPEIAVLVLTTLRDASIDDVAYDAFKAWRRGRKSLDDGVLVVIALDARRVRIETGRGVGGELTDVEASHIVEQHMAPLLRESRYADAIHAGARAITEHVGATAGGKPLLAPSSWTFVGFGIVALLALVLAVVSPGFRRVLLTGIAFGAWQGGGVGRTGGGLSGGGGSSSGGGASRRR